jgi:hypothetical protein
MPKDSDNKGCVITLITSNGMIRKLTEVRISFSNLTKVYEQRGPIGFINLE